MKELRRFNESTETPSELAAVDFMFLIIFDISNSVISEN